MRLVDVRSVIGHSQRRFGEGKMALETPMLTNTKIVVPMNSELVNIIGEMAGIVPLAGRGPAVDKPYAGAPVRNTQAERPVKGNGG